ncbi:unnamed protein product [Acanthoscelides obtectus]|uniref:Uncharacterized protein n=1 Tax=Acanthoscelides obtectus TaxID=200917 RepID=A0A9P0KEZ0_ACAOB|nr:unnamed protein product [Acanthoscelides obtectus]CAK1648166.1 Peripherin-2 [Acanthoscelides obtectus]
MAAFKSKKEKIEEKLKKRSLLKKGASSKVTDEHISEKVKFGKPVLIVSYTSIKVLTGIIAVMLAVNVAYSLSLLYTAIRLRSNLGQFLNMVANGDGDILPSTQAIPVFIFLVLNVTATAVTLRFFNRPEDKKGNTILFVLLIISLVMVIVTWVVIIYIVLHAHKTREHLHDGITLAMKSYGNDSASKKRIDRLQIELQCCGSKGYDEWYNVTWMDKSLMKKGTVDNSEGNTPFSCCSLASSFPCIHHDIEKTGKVYLYTPEQNLSISTVGCFNKLREQEKAVGWNIVGNLFLYTMLQLGLIICLRFLQTGHSINWKFVGHGEEYVIWLVGRYARKKKIDKDNDQSETSSKVPLTEAEETELAEPPLPPIPSAVK